MIWKIDFDTVKDFLLEFDKVKEHFPMTNDDYLERDASLYKNSSFMQYTMFYDKDDVVAVIAFKKRDKPLPDSQHISIFEVNDELKGQGYGTHIMRAVTEEGKWTLFAEDHNRHFYEQCGFVKSTIEYLYKKGF